MPCHSLKKFRKTWTVTSFFSTCFKRPGLGFSNSGLNFQHFFLLIYTLHFFDILFLIIMPNHSSQKFQKTWTVYQFLQHVFQTFRFGVSELGIRFEALFQCFIYSVSSTFYSKSSSLSITHKSFLKHEQLLGYFSTCFKRPGLGFLNQGLDFKHFFTALYPPILRHSILNRHA